MRVGFQARSVGWIINCPNVTSKLYMGRGVIPLIYVFHVRINVKSSSLAAFVQSSRIVHRYSYYHKYDKMSSNHFRFSTKLFERTDLSSYRLVFANKETLR